MEYKTTTRLFRGIYQYKIVLICAGAGWFRNGDWDNVATQLKKVDFASKTYNPVNKLIKTQEEFDYASKLLAKISKLSDIDIRVESPYLSVYTNTKSNVDALTKLDKAKVKYISVPPANTNLEEGTVIMPKVDFEFKVTLSKSNTEHTAFIDWAESNDKVKLTKSTKRALQRPRSWGGTHFYITGEKNLMLARLHLGSCIGKVERIIKA